MQFSVFLQAIPHAILLLIEMFAIFVLVPTFCNAYKLAKDNPDKNAIIGTTMTKNFILTTKFSCAIYLGL